VLRPQRWGRFGYNLAATLAGIPGGQGADRHGNARAWGRRVPERLGLALVGLNARVDAPLRRLPLDE
jgi:hypothetical protein